MPLNVLLRLKGGPGSGHRGHAGRPGKRGGSAPGLTKRQQRMWNKVVAGKPLTEKQQPVWDKITKRIDAGELPELESMFRELTGTKPVAPPTVKPTPTTKPAESVLVGTAGSDASGVRIDDAFKGEEKRIRSYLEVLPQYHLQTINDMRVANRLSSTRRSSGKIVAGTHTRGSIELSRSSALTSRGEFGGAFAKEVTIHETGHAVQHHVSTFTGDAFSIRMGGRTFNTRVRAAARVHNGLRVKQQVSRYARMNSQEFFAESYFAYTHKTKSLKLKRTAAAMEGSLGFNYYDLMKDLFGGREYNAG